MRNPTPVRAATGALAAVVGLLPWLVTGAHLPHQQLWSGDQGSPPLALLPLSQEHVAEVIALHVTAGALAGLALRLQRGRWSGRAVPATAAGMLLVQGIAAVQSLVTVSGGLPQRTASTVYLAALVALLLGALVAGTVVLALTAARPRSVAVPGFALGALFLPVRSDHWWWSALLVGVVIAWGGLRSAAQVTGAVAALALVWLVPTAQTVLDGSVGNWTLLRFPADLVGTAVDVFRLRVTSTALVVPPLVVAAAVGLGGSLLSARVRR
ncbi:hypothetical protein [Kineococcus sp. NPDC059986]|uniref:hypothetical protein n=1 Tax=Kineococcus sp. NPDC059986 TaxID=3155538 RepID=UPI00344FFB62